MPADPRVDRWSLALFVVALAVAAGTRLRPLIELDRFGLMAYDEGVYFLRSRALTLGYLPYLDLVHLHPPGVFAALAPFTPFASWGFPAAMVLVALLGVSTALVWEVARFEWG